MSYSDSGEEERGESRSLMSGQVESRGYDHGDENDESRRLRQERAREAGTTDRDGGGGTFTPTQAGGLDTGFENTRNQERVSIQFLFYI